MCARVNVCDYEYVIGYTLQYKVHDNLYNKYYTAYSMHVIVVHYKNLTP